MIKRRAPRQTSKEIAARYMYSPTRGRILHACDKRNQLRGEIAGSEVNGKLMVSVDRLNYYACDIAHYLMTGEWATTYCINGNYLDIRWSNIAVVEEPKRKLTICYMTHDTETGEIETYFSSNLRDYDCVVLKNEFRCAVGTTAG